MAVVAREAAEAHVAGIPSLCGIANGFSCLGNFACDAHLLAGASADRAVTLRACKRAEAVEFVCALSFHA
jgi:hypothetical protein